MILFIHYSFKIFLKTLILITVTIDSYSNIECSLKTFGLLRMNEIIITGDIPLNGYYNNLTLFNVTVLQCASIGNYAFQHCANLKEIKFDTELSNISLGCFKECSSLQKITLPRNLKFINDEAFYYCNMLTDIHIPDTVEV